jgi:hypothetical protein
MVLGAVFIGFFPRTHFLMRFFESIKSPKPLSHPTYLYDRVHAFPDAVDFGTWRAAEAS